MYSDSNGGYSGLAGDIDGTLLDCTTADSMFQDVDSGMVQYTDATTNYPAGTTIRCSSTVAEYAVSASLNNGNFWCVDWTGVAKEVVAIDHITAHPDADTTCN
ncbi:MAG: hypothetical protein UT61_C0019G0007 [Candidatus Woesebacteria bacterium GW2011_GWA1_39_8]|uniref:Uncharacterized protein n=1 Tax=Candidatus Woesebacteria bacterium GW2011_GWA1_39_8 TaxID=1618552 RepID=A0A0G0S5A2_9BACT|nr:MAG: hypothetical protein UT61_C0019G0007 [Candidatus Woesebacteria bacterium GW2011_GWA1_39_8]